MGALLRVLVLVAAGVVSAAAPCAAHADEASDFLAGKSRACVKCSLVAAPLQQKDLSGVALTGADLTPELAAEFATEMFVIINSTHTRINKSHLVDLYEKIEWGTDPHKKLAARLVRALYDESDSPLRYHVNMLGGRSQRDMWINQAQLFGEVHRFVTRKDAETWTTDGRGLSRDRAYGFLRDVLRAAKRVFGDAWGDNKRYMVTRDVTLKALIRAAVALNTS